MIQLPQHLQKCIMFLTVDSLYKFVSILASLYPETMWDLEGSQRPHSFYFQRLIMFLKAWECSGNEPWFWGAHPAPTPPHCSGGDLCSTYVCDGTWKVMTFSAIKSCPVGTIMRNSLHLAQ